MIFICQIWKDVIFHNYIFSVAEESFFRQYPSRCGISMETMPAVEEAEGMTLPPLPCVNASELISKTTDRAFHDVRRLANILSRVNLDARREDLLDYIRLNRARFMRAYVTVRWLSGRHGELVINASNALAEAQTQREQIDTVRCNFNSTERTVPMRSLLFTYKYK